MSDRWKNILWPAAFGLAFLAVWQLGWFHALLDLAPFQLPIPSEIVDTLGKNLSKTLGDGAVTVSCALIGMVIGSFLGFLIAVVATMFPKWGYGGLIVVSALNAIPIVALSPIMNRWFSDGMEQKIGVVTVVTMAAMAINAYRGLNDLRPYSLDLMRTYAAKGSTVFFQLRLPNALPSVFTALKINVTSALIAAIVSEYFASSTSGLGFGIKDNLRKAEMAMGWAYITVASVAGVLLYLIIVFLERKATRWHASQRSPHP
jgi:NitT/TauT family transport system permease protein